MNWRALWKSGVVASGISIAVALLVLYPQTILFLIFAAVWFLLYNHFSQ